MIVPVTNENQLAWADLCAALWPHHTAEERLRERAAGMSDDEFVYLSEGEAVAFVSLSLRHDYVEGTRKRPVGYLEGIYVKPEYRHRGIARELVSFAKEWSKEQGCSQLASDCELSNQASRAFHGSIGFEEANTIVCFVMEL